jgi:transcriptional regulator with XRE-family HTH domain
MRDQILVKFGSRVRAERKKISISQEELAARTGLHRTYIGAVERGERNIGLLNVFRIARALGVPAFILLGGVDRRSGR